VGHAEPIKYTGQWDMLSPSSTPVEGNFRPRYLALIALGCLSVMVALTRTSRFISGLRRVRKRLPELKKMNCASGSNSITARTARTQGSAVWYLLPAFLGSAGDVLHHRLDLLCTPMASPVFLEFCSLPPAGR
jgi:hypothetical protein